MKRKIRIFAVLVSALVMFSYSAKAQWEIPADASAKKAPTAADAERVIKGKEIYYGNCNTCHGDPQAGNALQLTPVAPPDLGSEAFLALRNEGDIYHQITVGQGGMPSFAKTLTDEQRWLVVQYIRSYSPESTVDLSSQKKSLDLKVNLDEAKKTITAVVTGKNEAGESVPMNNVGVKFLVKRYFGNLPVGQVNTNEDGYASVDFPQDLPGSDTLGTAEIIVQFSNADLDGDAQVVETVAWGKPFHYINPLDSEEMWGNRSMTPTWLLITYFSVVGGVWLTILWVVGQIMKIRKVGKWYD